ncbi:phospholipase D-like domain-containing protein [Nonomuraea endophytica]|uniref:phospholipase D-like domain-containing protein n=1 Tax=Nonomuraea endophytica TaxID=714136 RepID=UPI0037C9B20C
MEYLNAVEAELKSVSPGMEGTLWSRTPGNKFDTIGDDPASWILQVPDCWGWTPSKGVPIGAEKPGIKKLLGRLRHNLAQASRTVDITGFGPPDMIGSPAGPFPDGDFIDAMLDGIKEAVGRHEEGDDRLIVRFMTGVVGVDRTADPWVFRDALIKRLGTLARQVDLRVCSMTTRGVSSYNHTKFVIVDGQSVIHGGINWMTNYYIEEGPLFSRGFGDTAPVTDLDIALRGPAALSAGKFLDMLWEWARTHAGWVKSGWIKNRKQYPAWIAVEKPSPPAEGWSLYVEDEEDDSAPYTPGDLQVISVGSLGYGILDRDKDSTYERPYAEREDQAASYLNNETNLDSSFMTVNPDANAIRALVAHAKTSIVLSQQDINGFTGLPLMHALFDVRLLDVLAKKMMDGVKVRIVISNPGSPDYSNISSVDVAYKSLYQRVRLKTTYDAQAHRLLRHNLQLAPLRVSDEQTWPGGYKYRLHSKVVCVDETAFYVGSRNVYPDTTQDHGFIIQNAAAAALLVEHFLDKQWLYSRNAAICDWEW